MQLLNAFELDQDKETAKKINPTVPNTNYRGMHLFVLAHGF